MADDSEAGKSNLRNTVLKCNDAEEEGNEFSQTSGINPYWNLKNELGIMI